MKKYILIAVSILLASCNNKQKAEEGKVSEEYKVHYAQGFSVSKYLDYTKVTVRNPWDTINVLQTYILVDREKDMPSNLPQGVVIRTPLKEVIAYSTIHCSTLLELGKLNIVKGVCESQYMKFDEIQQGVKDGTIKDFGMASSPDVEQMILLSPDAILAMPISGQNYGNAEKIGIPIIETPDYTEPLPLGRAEWIRFYSLFLNEEAKTDSLFAIIEKNYNEIKETAKKSTKKPTTFTDQKYQNSWNLPGGKSFMATMLNDAGGNYVWADDESTTFLPLSFETVLDKAGEADSWLIKYYAPQDMTYESLKKDYKPYSYFKAYKEQNIWGCNTFYSGYYEDLPIHPEWILKDYAYAFNPELFPDYTPKYFKKLK